MEKKEARYNREGDVGIAALHYGAKVAGYFCSIVFAIPDYLQRRGEKNEQKDN